MTDEEIVAILQRQLEAAQEAGPTSQDFIDAQAYLYGRPRGDELPGRSVVQSLDVADMVQAMKAQILPSFTQDTVCSFEPDAPDDEAQCRLESDAVNKTIMESSRGFVVFYEAIHDALAFKNGVIKAYLDEDDGRRYIRLKAIDPASFYAGSGTDCILLYESDFLCERKTYTRGELLDMGFAREKIDELQAEGWTGSDGTAVNRIRRQQLVPSDPLAGWATETVPVYEAYTQLDPEDSGTTELYRCLWSGQTLLLRETADYIPYAAGTGFIEPHNFWGLSMFDRLRTVQDVKTAIKRQWLDNLANNNNSRTMANEQVNVEDLLNGRPGGVIRVKGIGPVQESASPLPVMDAGPAAQAFLAYMDQVRADRGGAVLQLASGEAQLLGGQIGSQGVDRIYSVQEMTAAMVARTLAETLLRSTFMLVHRLLRTELKEPMMLRMADQWVEVDPSTWRERVRVNIKSGLSPGERSRKAAAMTQVLQYQLQAIQGGLDGVQVDMSGMHNALLDWCSAQEIEAGEKYFMNPAGQKAQQAAQGKLQQGEQQQQMQMQLAQIPLMVEQMKQQGTAQAKEQELMLAKYNADMDRKLEVWKEQLHAEIEEAKLIGTATADLQRIELEGRYALAAPGNSAAQGISGPGREAAQS